MVMVPANTLTLAIQGMDRESRVSEGLLDALNQQMQHIGEAHVLMGNALRLADSVVEGSKMQTAVLGVFGVIIVALVLLGIFVFYMYFL